MPRMQLGGKTALVTGGARRVGRAIVDELMRAGCRVAVHYHHSTVEAASLVHGGASPDSNSGSNLNGGSNVLLLQGDLRQRDTAAALVAATTAQLGSIAILVNSAADYARTPLATLDDDAFHRMHELNVAAPLRLMREAARAGVQAIVNIVDVAAWQPWPNWSAYAASKAALLHLTRCLALELAPAVRVNAVAPGTAIFPAEWSAERRAAQAARIPLGRSGEPTDVARAVRFLCEEDYLTGMCLPVDGGAGLR
jgi:NAD(P)-dependent dehydrogenase (short-subunit alcohol dehydrogenase family)